MIYPRVVSYARGDVNGVLKQPVSGFIDPISSLYPVDYDSDGVYDLM